jgi:hypothetical protein
MSSYGFRHVHVDVAGSLCLERLQFVLTAFCRLPSRQILLAITAHLAFIALFIPLFGQLAESGLAYSCPCPLSFACWVLEHLGLAPFFGAFSPASLRLSAFVWPSSFSSCHSGLRYLAGLQQVSALRAQHFSRLAHLTLLRHCSIHPQIRSLVDQSLGSFFGPEPATFSWP